jgi:hypothetical protein
MFFIKIILIINGKLMSYFPSEIISSLIINYLIYGFIIILKMSK